MKSNSVIFFTENAEANSKLIKLFEDIADVSVPYISASSPIAGKYQVP